MQQCPGCGASVNPGARFCPNCRYDMSQSAQSPAVAPTQVMQRAACPNCGNALALGVKFCPSCATPIGDGGYANQSNYPNAGYNSANRATNRTAIIIGAMVLLLLIGGGVAAYLLLNKSSGNSNSNAGAGSAQPGSPADTAKRMVRAIEGEDWNAFRNLATGRLAGELDEVKEAVPAIKRAGGISSIEIQREKVEGDTAEVGYVIKWGNGGTKDYGMRMVRESGVWKVKDMRAIEPPRTSSSSSSTNTSIDVNVGAGFRAGDRVRVSKRAGTLKPKDTGHTTEVECDAGHTGTIIQGGDNTVVMVRWDRQQWAEYQTGRQVMLESFQSTIHSSYLVKASTP